MLKDLGLEYLIRGEGETVTGQLPAPGQTIPGNTQVILYMGDNPTEQKVQVPDFTGMTRQQASDTAGLLGLYILVKGNTDVDKNVVVTAQSLPSNTETVVGTTVELTFTDTKAAD